MEGIPFDALEQFDDVGSGQHGESTAGTYLTRYNRRERVGESVGGHPGYAIGRGYDGGTEHAMEDPASSGVPNVTRFADGKTGPAVWRLDWNLLHFA